MGSYTQYPRATLWLLQDNEVRIGGPDPDAQPAFVVEVDPFYISKLPITNEQYEAYDSDHSRDQRTPGDEDPVVNVNFSEAVGYCDWYSLVSGKRFRLPTEVEWEYACRGGTSTRYYFGDDPGEASSYLCDRENEDGRLPSLETRRPNSFGLYDMLGMVWEWTGSLHRPYPASQGDGRDERHVVGPRVVRGGSFRTSRDEMGCGVRGQRDPGLRYDDVGFRIVRALREERP